MSLSLQMGSEVGVILSLHCQCCFLCRLQTKVCKYLREDVL